MTFQEFLGGGFEIGEGLEKGWRRGRMDWEIVRRDFWLLCVVS